MEHERREREHRVQVELMQEQMQAMRGWMERSMTREDERVGRANQMNELRLTKLSDSEDIEAYLPTFERMMRVYEVPEDRWVFKLAPQLTGKAQQAYAALGADEAVEYWRVREAVLRRYDVSEESYRRRFRTTRKKRNETFRELAVRLGDLAKKWLAGCDSMDEVVDMLVVEQILDTMGSDLKIWVSEKKPKSGSEAGGLADDYIQARRDVGDKRLAKERAGEPKRCHSCGKTGHLARVCPEPKKTSERPPAASGTGPAEKKEGGKFDPRKVKCFNCGVQGHVSSRCPERGFYCKDQGSRSTTRTGTVEGQMVSDIVLDTGCSRTMVHRDLVDGRKYLNGEAVTVRCAHGDTVLYPLAEVGLTLDDVPITVVTAVSETLSTSVLLGTDVPILGRLLQSNPSTIHTAGVEEAYVVRTRAQARQEAAEEVQQAVKERDCGVQPTLLEKVGAEVEEELVGSEFDDDLFREVGRSKPHLTRKQKREERVRHGLVRAKDQPQAKSTVSVVDGTELRELQQSEDTLAVVWAEAEGRTEPGSTGFFERDGLIYRKWVPAKREADEYRDQLVLPKNCRQNILHVAHTIPLGGHLGKKKTAMRIMDHFYWPTLFRDVEDYCSSCEECQKCTRRRGPRVPLVSLPCITTPFERIAMDIIGPLPRSRSGHRYVLVICDYGTRYPEAVPMKSVDAEHVAEELVRVFARVGLSKEVLTDQGTNFTSQLLAELYRLLGVKAIRTSPYHPQTDGLVERFNQTLKEMLRKSAAEDGKDWDKLIPYVLFAYREVPQESTGYSPFELLYGRDVRGPLDVLKEEWESNTKTDESVAAHVLLMRDRMEKMAELVEKNLRAARLLLLEVQFLHI